MSRAPPIDFHGDKDKENIDIIHAIYLNTISKQIADNADYTDQNFRKPLDTQAFRIAAEFVADYLATNHMANSSNICEKESQGYLRNRHDHSWVFRRLKLDESKDVVSQLLDLYDPDFQTTITDTQKGTKNTKTTTNTELPTDAHLIDSQNFTQFTGILTTNAGAEYTVDKQVETMNTFTQLVPEKTETVTGYDPRQIIKSKKQKPIPSVPQDRLENSKFKARDPQDVTTTIIDTIANRDDYNAYKNARKELRAAGLVTGTETMTTYRDENATTTYGEFKPRYEEPVVEKTWDALEDEADDISHLKSKSIFADSYEEMSKRKRNVKKMEKAHEEQNKSEE